MARDTLNIKVNYNVKRNNHLINTRSESKKIQCGNRKCCNWSLG